MAALATPPLLDLDLLDPSARERLARLGILQGTSGIAGWPGEGDASGPGVLSLDWPELERVLPDRGLPRGVIEIAGEISKNGAMRGGATTIALSAVRAVHAAGAGRAGAGAGSGSGGTAWCAWITESNAPPLYAPAAAQAGVDLDRLLVVRPQPVDLARTVVKVACSGAFDLVIVDAPSGLDSKTATGRSRSSRSSIDGSVVVRKLALAAEEKGTTFILLTNLFTSRAVPWPVALRLEVERRPEAIAVRVAKDRRGRASSQHVVRVAC